MPNIQKMMKKGDVIGLDKVIRTNKDSRIRLEAVEAVAQIVDERSVVPILAAHLDSDEEVRRAAARALDGCGPEAFYYLEKNLSPLYQEKTVKFAVIRGLERLQAVGGQFTLAMAFHWYDQEKDRDIQEAIIASLRRINAPRTVGDLWGDPLAFQNRKDKENIVWGLGLLGDPGAVEFLLGLLEEKNRTDARLGLRVIEALGKIGDVSARDAVWRYISRARRLGTWAKEVEALARAAEKLGLPSATDHQILYYGAIGEWKWVEEHLLERIRNGEDADISVLEGDTALMLAAYLGHRETAEELLARGANPNHDNDSGTTALMLAADAGHPEIVKLLVAKGADINRRWAQGTGKSALFYAADRNKGADTPGYQEIVGFLMSKGAKNKLEYLSFGGPKL